MQNYLPRILYIGNVPVEATLSGSTLLYRLFQKYPIDKVRIVEVGPLHSKASNRIPYVHYDAISTGFDRLFFTRWSSLLEPYLFFRSKLYFKILRNIVHEFRPEAILTVMHGFSWITAAKLAEHFQIPLHLIIHDDWSSSTQLPTWWKQWIMTRKFGDVYRNAQSRFCASPYMMDTYQKQYGISGTVLYPSRAADSTQFQEPPERIAKKKPTTFVYAGSIYQGYVENIRLLGSILESLELRLIIYSPVASKFILENGLDRPNIDVRPAISSSELICKLRTEADVLFVPMSFAQEHRVGMQIGFPSKLADYTAVGLPLLIFGPRYCSAVHFAHENSGFAAVVDEYDGELLKESIINVIENQDYRFSLASKAIKVGSKHFSHEALIQRFYASIKL